MTRLFLGMLLLVAVGACRGTVQVRSFPDPPPSLRGYRTFSWISRQTAVAEREPELAGLDASVRRTVEEQLGSKGYEYRTMAAPDFLVSYHISVKEKQAESFADLYAYRQAGGNDSMQEAFARGFEEGTLVLELTDARSRRPLWRASAAAIVGREPQPERIAEAVRQMLRRLPAAE